jgi:hypothetical protein
VERTSATQLQIANSEIIIILLAYVDDVNLLGDNIDAINKKEALIDASMEVGLEVNIEKIKYMLMSRNRNEGQNREIK